MSRSAFCYQVLFGTLVVLASALNAETLTDIKLINQANETTTLSGEITTLNLNIDPFTNSDESTDRYDVLDATESDQNGNEDNLNISTIKNNDTYYPLSNDYKSKLQRQNDSSINPEGNEVENSSYLTQLGNANTLNYSNIDFIKKDDTKTVKNNTKESAVSGANSRARSIHELSKMFGLENENVPPEYITILEKMKPEERLTSTLAFKKRYIEAQFDPVTYFNKTGPPQETETPENYGISIVLSSDIVALTSVVETMEDSLCKNQSLRLLRGLLTGKLWALKMYDASAKSPTGLLWGNTFQLGNFDECLQARSNDDDQEIIRGQYCLANVELTKKTFPTIHYGKRTGPREDIHWAVCVPASCSASQIKQFVSNLLISSPGGGKITLEPNQCHKEDTLKLQNKDVIFGSFMLGFSAILVTCTIFHIYIKMKNKNQPKKTPTILVSAILSFSIARNMRKIFSVKKNEHGLDAIAGIRTLSMFLILTGHALIFIFSGPVMNSGFYDDMLKRVENTLLLSNPLLVDTFLLISAFLFCRLLLVEFDKRKGHVNVIPIYLFRYLRVTPSYFVVISLYMTWLDKLGSGPLWDAKMQVEKERCLESWWTNILYINNYVNTENLCMFQSWYLSVDTQLFFLAPAIIYPLWRWQRVGEWILGVITCVATFIPFVVTYWQELDPTLLPFPKEVVDISSNFYFKEAYIKTHMRASAYFIGLLSGYILHKIQTTGHKLKTKQLVIGWTLAIVCGASSVFTVSVFFQSYYIYNPLYAATYSALHRVAWAASTGWLLIVCSTKNGGPLGRIFLWKPLIPLGRLTFCAYLVNGLVELHSLGTLRDSIHLSIFGLTVLCFSHILQTFVGALVLCVMFESPIHGFEKILLKALGNHQRRTPREEIKQDLESTRR